MPTTREVTIPSKYTLSGTITLPDDTGHKKPAVVIIPGSEKADREGNVGFFKSNILYALSDIFTQQGYITLRYDKRGVGKSTGGFYETGLIDFLDDAISVTRFLKTVDEVDANRIIVLGHSEGALLAPAVFDAEKVDGLILLCGAASAGNELMPLPGKKLVAEIQAMTGLKGYLCKLFKLDYLALKFWNHMIRKALSSKQASIKIFGIKKMNAKWVREFNQFDVRAYLKKVTCPTLVIGGGKDIQADPTDTEKIAALIPGPTETHVIVNMNHILCDFEGEHHLLTLLREYKGSLKSGISSELKYHITNWLNSDNNT